MEMTDISRWASSEIKTITCTQDVLGTKFDLKVREFVPVDGDALARKWKKNGVEKSFECPPYGVANMKEAAHVLGRFVDRSMGSAICFYVDETDRLLRDTYEMAYRQSKFAQVRIATTTGMGAKTNSEHSGRRSGSCWSQFCGYGRPRDSPVALIGSVEKRHWA